MSPETHAERTAMRDRGEMGIPPHKGLRAALFGEEKGELCPDRRIG